MKLLNLALTAIFAAVSFPGLLQGATKPIPRENSLIEAIKQNQQEKINHHLSNGTNVNERDKDRNTPLMWAAGNGRLEVVQQLLNRGAYISAQNIEGKTALMWAADNNQLNTLKALIEAGAGPDAKNNSA
jgi:ankyrin repeat protein